MNTETSLIKYILNQDARALELQSLLTAIPAIGPENGGDGEAGKAVLVESLISGADRILHLDCPDSRVKSGIRPNIIALFNGKTSRRLWLFGHLDVVPAGDVSLWQSDPFVVRKDGDFIFGRGVEDNQQAVAGMIILAESLQKLKITPRLGLGLVFMADEECGSSKGLEWILKEQPQLFAQDDYFIIPDGGSHNADFIEIAEKAQLWLKFQIIGKQCHASTPPAGNNAFLAGCSLALKLDQLKQKFARQDLRFSPPTSTFVPTKSESGSDAVNIVPGKFVFYMDCRLLPGLSFEEVLDAVQKLCRETEKDRNVKIHLEIIQRQDATETSAKTPVIQKLEKAIKNVYGVNAKTGGIGGATVAAFLRKSNLPGVVWACLQNTCHQPNECCSLKALVKDAAVFAEILMDSDDV